MEHKQREQPGQPGRTRKDDEQPAQPQPGQMSERGATEEQVVPLKPPMSEPIDPTRAEHNKDDDEIDPRDELTPG